MRSLAHARSFAALLMIVCLLFAPITALAKKGEKNYKRGLEYEAAQQWELAAQEFALAIAALPSDIEYQVHYRRAIFQASQVFMQKGRTLAEQGDYVGAYNAYRRAYGYDQANEIALAEMERMLRLQRKKDGLPERNENDKDNNSRERSNVRIAPTSLQTQGPGGTNRPAAPGAQDPPALSPRTEQLRVINYNGELEPFIRQLATQLNLNVIFDRDFSQVGKRPITVNLRDVTTARALDYLFTSQGIFFQRLDRRTILVADQSKRPQYQQLVLRTFFLQNVAPEDARNLITQALPPSQGRQQAAMYPHKTTNSLTVRDTPETIRIITDLIKSIDKDRPEVVMDVSIYEVSRTDLLQIGNQFGTAQAGNLGGISSLAVTGGSRQVAEQVAKNVPTALGVGLVIPASVISALQSKDRTRLVYQTQLRAFDGEASTANIGQKVPIQTAQVPNYYGVPAQGQQQQQQQGGIYNPGVYGAGYPVIQYQDVGLNLNFTPQVFPSRDVQVKMEIDSSGVNDVTSLTPIITQRKIKGVTRIPDGRTMMIAGIAQNRISNGRQGLPLVGLVPIVGRLFTSPTRNDTQSDIIITVTPRVLRAPNVTPEDEELRPSGSMQTPATETLEAIVRDADREDQLAAAAATARQQNASASTAPTTVNLPVQESHAFVPAPKALVESAGPTQTANNSAATPSNVIAVSNNGPSTDLPRVIPAAAASFTAMPIAFTSAPTDKIEAGPSATLIPVTPSEASNAELRLVTEGQALRVGEKGRLVLMLKTDAPLGLATATLRFDPRVVAVRSISKGAMFTNQVAAPMITQSIDPKGMLLVSIAPGSANPLSGEGALLTIELEAIAAGESIVSFDSDKAHLVAVDGRNVKTQVVQSKVLVQ